MVRLQSFCFQVFEASYSQQQMKHRSIENVFFILNITILVFCDFQVLLLYY